MTADELTKALAAGIVSNAAALASLTMHFGALTNALEPYRREQALKERAEMVASGKLVAARLPYRCAVDVLDAEIQEIMITSMDENFSDTKVDASPSNRLKAIIERTVVGKWELGFSEDGEAHIGVESDADRVALVLAL